MLRNLCKITILFLLFNSAKASAKEMQLLSAKDIFNIRYNKAENRIFYGKDKYQFGDLRLPDSQVTGPIPVLIIIHGGCWLSKFANIDFMSPFAESMTKSGIATWNIEYRPVDIEGGGWPGTFNDVSNAIDLIRKLAPQYNLDLNKIVVLGHSAGGHLALWAAARNKLKISDQLYQKNPLKLLAAINLSGPASLRDFLKIEEQACGCKIIEKLLGIKDAENQDRYLQSSPDEMLPLGIKQILITGKNDEAAPASMMENYKKKASSFGDDVEIIILDGGHFELIAPETADFQKVKDKILSIF